MCGCASIRSASMGGDIAITTSLRALASPWEVDEAQLPKVGPVERDPSASLITVQVGGEDVVYRGGGHVMHDVKVVGDPVKDGVLAELLSVPHPGCESRKRRSQARPVGVLFLGLRRVWISAFRSCACRDHSAGWRDCPASQEARAAAHRQRTAADHHRGSISQALIEIVRAN